MKGYSEKIYLLDLNHGGFAIVEETAGKNIKNIVLKEQNNVLFKTQNKENGFKTI